MQGGMHVSRLCVCVRARACACCGWFGVEGWPVWMGVTCMQAWQHRASSGTHAHAAHLNGTHQWKRWNASGTSFPESVRSRGGHGSARSQSGSQQCIADYHLHFLCRNLQITTLCDGLLIASNSIRCLLCCCCQFAVEKLNLSYVVLTEANRLCVLPRECTSAATHFF